MVCFWIPDDDYETCYAFYRMPDSNSWEAAPGGAWVWTECAEFDSGMLDMCSGGESWFDRATAAQWFGEEPAGDNQGCWWFYSEEEGQVPFYAYPGCVASTGWEYHEDPWSNPEHAVYMLYDDRDLACFRMQDDDYEMCYAFFRTEWNVWEFAAGGMWIWHECGADFDETMMYGEDGSCNGGDWGATRADFDYSELYMEDDGWDYFWECGSHEECMDQKGYDAACAVIWHEDGWENGQTCIEWHECDESWEYGGRWYYNDCWADGRFESAMKATVSIATALVLAYAM